MDREGQREDAVSKREPVEPRETSLNSSHS